MTSKPTAVALTVAGSDSSAGAGVQADLKTFDALGVRGVCAVTAVTAQNARGVAGVHVVPGWMVTAQIEAIAAEMRPGAIKTGMLATAEIVEAVAAAVEARHLWPLVVDPVVAATRGGRLLDPEGLKVMKEVLFPMCTLLTPNLPEAELLLGRPVTKAEEMPEAAAALGTLGPQAVLLKGGHLAGERSPDVLWRHGTATWIDGPRLPATHTHGTGCTLSAAITAHLASGLPLPEACSRGKMFVTAVIAAGLGIGSGSDAVDAPRN